MTLYLARLLLLFNLCGAWLGCERDAAPPPAPSSKSAPESTSPARIVSLAPSVTETLYELGAGERLVGVTRFCDFPAAAAALPKIGGLTDVDVEVVLSLRPDLVVGVASKTAKGLERTLAIAGVEVLFLPVETFDDVQRSMRLLGDRVGAQERGGRLADAIAATDLRGNDGPAVLVLFGRDPWIAAGPDTFADEMIRRAGGRNALADFDAPYPALDVETLSSVSPDIIIDTSWGSGSETPIPVVAPDAVVRIDPALIRPGPRLVDAMERFRSAIDSHVAPQPRVEQ